MTDAPNGERRSPLDAVHRAAGASFTDFAGWQMPVRYSSDLAEHHAVREAAGLFDLSHMAEILVLGAEAPAALDHALAGRISAVEEGQAKYSLLLAEDGGIIDDLVVYRTGPDRFLVVANAGNRAAAVDALRERAAGFDCVVDDESDDVGLIALQGPRSEEILRGVVPVGLAARDTLRLEAGFPLFGHELGPDTNPLCTPFGWVVKDKEFFGREALWDQPCDQRLVGLRLLQRGIPRAGYRVLNGGEAVGEVTSGALSPLTRDAIAFAWVAAELAAPGTDLAVEIRGQSVAASVVEPPFCKA
jgi:glycine cleavage system aminomethyltransferase T